MYTTKIKRGKLTYTIISWPAFNALVEMLSSEGKTVVRKPYNSFVWNVTANDEIIAEIVMN